MSCGLLTRLHRVLYAEHGGSAAVAHGLHQLLLGKVGAAVLHADRHLQVVEVAAVQLKELNEQDAQVDVGAPCVNVRVQLGQKGAEMFD